MIRTVTNILVNPYQVENKWFLIVESRLYGKAPNHVLTFDSKEEADKISIGYKYSTDDIYKEPGTIKLNALSIQQPFALLELLGIKDIENRSWKTNYRGRIYIHACARKKDNGRYHLTGPQKSIVSDYPIVESLLNENNHMYSAIIGHVDLIDIVEDSSSVWALPDNYHWILANPVMYERPITGVKGNLNLWDCSGYMNEKK